MEPGGDGPGVDGAATEPVAGHHFRDFLDNVAALEVQDALGELSLHPGVEVRERGDGAGDDETELLREGLRAGIDHLHVLEPQGLGDGLGDDGFLAHRIAQGEPGLREQDGQRDAREAAAGAEVQDIGRAELFQRFRLRE